MLFIPLLAVLGFVPSHAAMEFTPFLSSEQYKCGAFLQGRVEDKTLGFYYQTVDRIVAWLSNPFPHAELISDKVLSGDVQELREWDTEKFWQWFDWQRGWIILAGGLLAISIVFPLFYLLVRCCMCCCSSSSKKQTTDNQYDGCKRNLLNIFLAVFVLIDVFAAATLLITGQYAQYGLEELPGRLNRCVDDLNLYKRETDLRIRKLLIEDYGLMNRTLSAQLSSAGHNVVSRVKKLTGAQAIDTLLNVSTTAGEVQSILREVRDRINQVNEESTRFEVEFARLRKTATQELLNCVEHEADSLKSMCTKAESLLDSLQNSQFKINSELLSPETDAALQQIVDANIADLLDSSKSQFGQIEDQLQKEIDKKTHAAQNTLKQIGDDLFVVAETISTQVRQINFDMLYGVISQVSDEKQPVMKYVHISWYVNLAVTAIFVLLAFCFLFGLFYGMCGRRPTFYNDDCCVRSTGGKFFSCGIWLTVLLFTVLSALCAVMLFTVGNTSNLVCQPLRDPLGRADVMSFAERYLALWKAKREKVSEFNSLLDSRTPADVIRACHRNETFYQIFEFDKKYQLNQLKNFEQESYTQLEQFLKQSLAELPPVTPITSMISEEDARILQKLGTVNVTQISKQGLAAIKSAVLDLDLLSKAKSFQESVDNSGGRPKAVSSILEQLEEIDLRIARPLRIQLDALYRNLTALDERLGEMQVPVTSLLSKIQHAQALLSEDVRQHFENAAREELNSTMALVDQYIEHVREKMQHEVSSCAPIAELADSSTAALCAHTVDPMNGAWMAMLVSLLCLIPIVFISTSLVNLYSRMHSFPKYIVEAPQDHHQMSSFITDTYDTRQKPGYANYSYTDDYHRTYR